MIPLLAILAVLLGWGVTELLVVRLNFVPAWEPVVRLAGVLSGCLLAAAMFSYNNKRKLPTPLATLTADQVPPPTTSPESPVILPDSQPQVDAASLQMAGFFKAILQLKPEPADELPQAVLALARCFVPNARFALRVRTPSGYTTLAADPDLDPEWLQAACAALEAGPISPQPVQVRLETPGSLSTGPGLEEMQTAVLAWLFPFPAEGPPAGFLLMLEVDPAPEVCSMIETLSLRLAELILAQADVPSLQPEPALILLAPQAVLLDELIAGQINEAEGLDYIESLATTLAHYQEREQGTFGLRPMDARVDRQNRQAFLSQHVDLSFPDRRFFEGFSAPELINAPPGPQSEVFALGALLFSLYHRRLPRLNGALVSLIENLPPASETLGIDYLLRKSLWPAVEHRLAAPADFLRILQQVRRRPRNFSERLPNGVIEVGAETNVGVRKGLNRGHNSQDNEDRIFWDQAKNWTVLALADGVSRADLGSGYEAASLFVDMSYHLWHEVLDPRRDPGEIIQQIFQNANDKLVLALKRYATEHPHFTDHTMSAAACLVLARGGQVWLGHLGDVRAYLVGSGFVARLTRDHSRVADFITQAIDNPALDLAGLSNLPQSELVATVGQWHLGENGQMLSSILDVPILNLDLLPGETLVLASDGLYRYATEANGLFEDLLMKALLASDTPQRAAFRLIERANHNSGLDNISCLIYAYRSPSDSRSTEKKS